MKDLMVKKEEECTNTRPRGPPGRCGNPDRRLMAVKEPDCERYRLRPVHAALLLDTSLSSAACGFERILHFAEHRELHLGMSTGL